MNKNKLIWKIEVFRDVLFYAEAWKGEGSLTLNLALVSRMVISRARKHETHRCQTRSRGPDVKKLRPMLTKKKK